MRKISMQRLREVLDYNPDTGEFVWIKSLSNKGKVGSVAGSINAGPYLIITIDRKRYRAHRLAWFYVTGEWADGFDIDHKNGIEYDNRIDNLRIATRSQNNANSKRQRLNTTGFKGVSTDKKNGKFRAYINNNGRRYSLGNHATAALAHEAYVQAAKRVFGEFWNGG